MSLIKFTLINDLPGGTNIEVNFDDNERPFIEDILSAFEQFLLAVTFQPETIAKYLDVEAVQKELVERARLVAELKAELAAKTNAKVKKVKKS